jgi:hypothetical protein
VRRAEVAQATAMGAALGVHQRWNPFPVTGNLVRLGQVI